MNNVIPATLASFKLMADNTLRATLDIEPNDVKAFLELFSERGDLAAIARLHDSTPQYSTEAQTLYQSSFFRTPAVWKAVGTDAEYQIWTHDQKCVICGNQDLVEETGEMKCEFAHVRRAGEAGTSYKPEYSGVPMCHDHHQMQHQFGESGVLIKTGTISGSMTDENAQQVAKEWFERKAVGNAHKWVWETLKDQLGYQSWKEIVPIVLITWAEERDLDKYLPFNYK